MNQIIEITRIIVGSIYVLFLPGYFLSFIFIKKGVIDVIERIALSFALSISVVPLVAFYLNMLGIRLGVFSIFLEILGIIGATIFYLYFINIKAKKDAPTI